MPPRSWLPHDLVRLVSLHDSLDQLMAHDVASIEECESDPLNAAQDELCVMQSRHPSLGQIRLCQIGGDHRTRTKTNARQEHLHLLDGGVLSLIEDDERLIQ